MASHEQAGLGAVRRPTIVALALVAVVGCALGIEGLGHDQLRHQVVAAGVGAVLVAPLLLTVFLGRRGLRVLKLVAFGLVPTCVLLLLVEVAVRVWGLEPVGATVLVSDPVLGYGSSPDSPGLDSWGFRNASVPERADVVCLGDSQTFGFFVRRTETYPAVLARSRQLTVYNLGHGGYGPIQYLALTERASQLEPKVIVIGLYFGNDLVDAHRYAGLAHWSDLRDPAIDYPELVDMAAKEAAPYAIEGLDALARRSTLLSWAKHGILTSLSWVASPASSEQPDSPRYEKGQIHTVFGPDYRMPAVDLARPTIRDGMRITKLCFERIQKLAAARGIALALLLINTKEYHYHRFMTARGDAKAAELDALARCETAAVAEIEAMAGALGIRVVNPAKEVSAALGADRPIWGPTADGHMNAHGAALMARLLERELADLLPQ